MQVLVVSVALALTLSLSATQSVDIFCDEPPAIQSASIEYTSDEEYSLGTIVTYACEFGYTARGKNRTLRCEKSDKDDDAAWTHPQFACIPQSCGDPGYINNGRRVGSLFTFPNSVKYECDEGYKLKGLSARYCQTGGTWSGRLPVCEEITCKPPRNPDNGYVTHNSLEFGSELHYKCDKGFHLNTDEKVFCTSDGRWSNTDVQCVESACDIPPSPEHGSVQLGTSDNSPRAGSIAIFSCNGDRIADGPTTSKCLDTGEWTFSPPKCLEPCSIPDVTNGIIGIYVRQGYRRHKVFQQVPVGYRIDDDEELFLSCDEDYEASGSEKREVQVSCNRGRWSREPHCVPASCRSEPPSMKNGQPIILNPEHGGRVLYMCDTDFKKIKNETVICDFGTWKGNVPICKSTICPVGNIRFPGLLKGNSPFYRDGEVFKIECDSRYRVANERLPQLKCEEGTWKGTMPPCVAASCTKPPPQIVLGRPEVSSTVHSTILKYVCEDPFIPVGNSQVQCLFGEWEGQPPKCEDSRCYLKNLRQLDYIETTETSSITLSGYQLYALCKDGYSPRSERPFCLNGKWTRDSVSPCKESDCTVPLIYHGDLTEQKLGDYYWNWKKFRYDREMKYIKIPAGTILSPASSLLLFCSKGYSFQGSSIGIQGITCFKGRWQPDPVCLRVGETYVPKTTTSRFPKVTTSLQTARERSETAPEKSTPMSIIPTTTTTIEPFENVSPVDEEIFNFETKPSEEECYCEYPINEENLVAHAGGKRLKFRDKVRNGSVVIFRCEHVGFHLLIGKKEIKCEGCRNWHSSEFPTCIEPRPGSAVILSDNTLNVSIDGNLEGTKGQNIKLMCVAMESSTYPDWSIPTDDGVTLRLERKERKSYGDILYISHLEIQNAAIENEGPYGCAVGNNSMTIVHLVINDPNLRCLEFPEEDGISVTYDMERRVRSQAFFSCTKHNLELTGKDVLTCLRNGEWSDPPPQCTDIKCKELKENDLLSVYYTNDREIGSMATFHCFAPAQRSGASFAKCLENGTWSNPTPACRPPPCSLEELFSAVPQNVVPDVDNANKTFLYNTTVKLTCAEDMIVEGNSEAKCGKKGDWEFENIRCISGCPSLKHPPDDSKLIIRPEKDVYKLGEMITFSCPPGMNLDTQSQLIMCLKYGWSETILPECQ